MLVAVIVVTIPLLALMFAVPLPARILFCALSVCWGVELMRGGAPKALTFAIFATTGIALTV